MYSIGQVAKKVGLAVKTVRYYADIELVKPSMRSEKGYRLYSEKEKRKLGFIAHARGFGFSIESCRELLALYEDRQRSSAEVKQIALERLAEIRRKMTELQVLHDELAHLAEACQGDCRPDCPILDSLAAGLVHPGTETKQG